MRADGLAKVDINGEATREDVQADDTAFNGLLCVEQLQSTG